VSSSSASATQQEIAHVSVDVEAGNVVDQWYVQERARVVDQGRLDHLVWLNKWRVTVLYRELNMAAIGLCVAERPIFC